MIRAAAQIGADQSVHERRDTGHRDAVDKTSRSASEVIIRIERGIVVAERKILGLYVLVSLDLHTQIPVEVAGTAENRAIVDLAVGTARSATLGTCDGPVWV